MYLLHILTTIAYIRFCSSNYEYVCPKALGWRIRGKALCANTTTYSCLHDENKDTFREICRQKPNSLAPGSKFVIRGNLDGKVCNDNRYQPFIFKTNESKECAIEKSYCNEEGQIEYSNGSTTKDKSCRCDYSKGYAPITKTNNLCYCMPSEEDCSCYLKLCPDKTHLSSEYTCVSDYTLFPSNNCSKITLSRSSVSNTTSTIIPNEDTEQYTTERDDARRIVKIMILAIEGLLLAAFLVIISGKLMWTEQTIVRTMEEGEAEFKQVNINVPIKVIEKDEEFNRGKEIRDIHSRHITEWEKDDEKFIETKATNAIFERLNRNSCVIVVGRPGIGKSTIIRHIALKMRSLEGYEIIPIVLSASNILEFINKNQNQIFIVDDFCGKENINAQSVDDWSSIIDKIHARIETSRKIESQNLAKVKFLFATGLKIYKDSQFQKFERLKKFVCEISEWPLTDDDKLKMINRYLMPKVGTELSQKLKSDKEYFPLLCKISENKSPVKIIQLFDNLDAFIEQDLLDLKKNDTIKFCIITLCALLNNMFKEELLNEVYESNIEKQAFEKVCSEFTSETNKESFKCEIKKQLENLEGMYVTKTENYYHFIHAKVYHIAVWLCGQLFLDSFIEFVRSSFIAERFCFQSENSDKKVAAITIGNQDAKTKYFNRLMFDLEQGNTYSTFHNSQLQSDSYRNTFCSHFGHRKQEFILLLKQFSEHSDRNYEDYIDFKRQHHFYAHKMRKPLIESAWEGYADIITLLLHSECNINEADKFGRTALFVACLLGNTKVVNVLLDNNADHSLCDKNEQSPLLVACKNGYTDIVDALLHKNSDINKCDRNGNSPILVASFGSHLSTVQLLSSIHGKADFSKQNNLGQTAVLVASMNGRKDVVKFLLQYHSKDISISDQEDRSPLFIACREGHYNVVQQLLKKNANFLKIDSNKRSPLFIACREGHHDIVKLLLANQADVFQSDVKERSPLFIASAGGYADIVKTLIENNAEINQCDEKGMRPLFIAIDNGHTKTAKMLVIGGADLNVTDHKKRTPLYAACRRGILEMVELLHKHNASITLCDNSGGSPLLIACRHSHFDVVKYLLKNGCNISSSNLNGTTPLLVAIENGNTEMVKFLVANNSDINQSDSCKMTPLHASVLGGHADIVQFLIDKGAHKTVIDDDYKTPLDLALEHKYTNITDLLNSYN